MRSPPAERRLRAAFAVAFGGFGHALRTQVTFRVQVGAALVVLALAVWLRLRPIEAALVVGAVALVLAAELANSALEALVDLLSPDPHPLARRAKDLAAATVLTVAGGAAAVGGFVLVPRLAQRLGVAAGPASVLAWGLVGAGVLGFLAVASRAGRSS